MWLAGLGFLIAWGERSERAKRASEALWCFLWVSIAYPCFRWRTLAFSCFLLLRFFACCLAFSFEWYLGIPSLMLYSVFGCWTLQGLFSVVSGLCWALLVLPGIFLLFLAFPGLVQPFLAFVGLWWPLLGFNACYYCWGRAKRASKASERSSLVLSLGFPCLPMLLLAHPCFLLLSVASLLCMLSGIFF